MPVPASLAAISRTANRPDPPGCMACTVVYTPAARLRVNNLSATHIKMVVLLNIYDITKRAFEIERVNNGRCPCGQKQGPWGVNPSSVEKSK